jgi:hypothetical protein
LAGKGFFVKELNCGIAEWKADGLPLHAARLRAPEVRCECSIGLTTPRPADARAPGA